MKKKIYLIQYSLINEILDKRIQSLGPWYQLQDGWLVQTELSSKQIYEKMAEDFDSLRMVIFEIKDENFYGYYDPKLWEWLNKMTPKKTA